MIAGDCGHDYSCPEISMDHNVTATERHVVWHQKGWVWTAFAAMTLVVFVGPKPEGILESFHNVLEYVL